MKGRTLMDTWWVEPVNWYREAIPYVWQCLQRKIRVVPKNKDSSPLRGSRDLVSPSPACLAHSCQTPSAVCGSGGAHGGYSSPSKSSTQWRTLGSFPLSAYRWQWKMGGLKLRNSLLVWARQALTVSSCSKKQSKTLLWIETTRSYYLKSVFRWAINISRATCNSETSKDPALLKICRTVQPLGVFRLRLRVFICSRPGKWRPLVIHGSHTGSAQGPRLMTDTSPLQRRHTEPLGQSHTD